MVRVTSAGRRPSVRSRGNWFCTRVRVVAPSVPLREVVVAVGEQQAGAAPPGPAGVVINRDGVTESHEGAATGSRHTPIVPAPHHACACSILSVRQWLFETRAQEGPLPWVSRARRLRSTETSVGSAPP